MMSKMKIVESSNSIDTDTMANSELRIRGDIKDNSKIIFLISQ